MEPFSNPGHMDTWISVKKVKKKDGSDCAAHFHKRTCSLATVQAPPFLSFSGGLYLFSKGGQAVMGNFAATP
jgi:hypothetical protein